MRYFVMTLLFLAGLILQSTIFPHLAFFGCKPDFVLIFVIAYSLLNGPKEGTLVGFIGGFLQDLVFGQYLGMNALAKLLIGYLFGLLERKVYKENVLIPVLAVFVGSFLNEGILYLLRLTVGNSTGNLLSVKNIMFFTALYNSGLTLFLYRKFFKSSQKGILRTTER